MKTSYFSAFLTVILYFVGSMSAQDIDVEEVDYTFDIFNLTIGYDRQTTYDIYTKEEIYSNSNVYLGPLGKYNLNHGPSIFLLCLYFCTSIGSIVVYLKYRAYKKHKSSIA